jgi:hypothetical protein
LGKVCIVPRAGTSKAMLIRTLERYCTSACRCRCLHHANQLSELQYTVCKICRRSNGTVSGSATWKNERRILSTTVSRFSFCFTQCQPLSTALHGVSTIVYKQLLQYHLQWTIRSPANVKTFALVTSCHACLTFSLS